MIRLALFLLLFAAPAGADPFCDDLWFARNQLFARAGFCFGSPLGQAVFGNAGCIGKEVTLEPGGAEMVAAISALEAQVPCKVDTTRRALEVENIGLRLRLEQVVFRSEFASGCLGWTGPALTLLAGPRPGAAPTGVVQAGDDIIWEYDSLPWPDGWSFISAHRGGVELGFGWYPGEIDQGLCSRLAG